jgi:hypothetical protein
MSPPPEARSPAPRRQPGRDSWEPHQGYPLRTSRAPSADRSHEPPSRSRGNDAQWAATGSLTLPPRAQLPTRVHAQSCTLDSTTLPAIHRSCSATCRLPTSAIGESPSTPRAAQTSSHVQRQAAARSSENSLRSSQPDSHRPGGALRITRWRPPVTTTARLTDLPRPDRSGHPMSRASAERHLEC